MRRICCFCEKWESGGIEAFLRGILTHMDRTDLHIDIVVARRGDSLFTEALQKAGITVTELSGSLRSPQNRKKFRALLAEKNYDVIHFNLFQGLSLHYVLLAKKMGVPTRIVHSHGAGLRKSPTKAIKLLLHAVGRLLWADAATDFWTCSAPAAQFLFGRDARIIPNGIDVDAYRFSPEARSRIRESLSLTDETVIGTVGRFSGEKNQTFLLDVFAAYAKQSPHSHLLLVGDGDEKTALQEKAAALGIAEKTTFYGNTPDVPALLSAMDVFVLPSLSEGLPLVCLEAQASGLPFLSADCLTADAKLTPHFTLLPLSLGVSPWAEALTHLAAAPRQDGASAVRAAGYAVEDAASLVERVYREVRP